MAINGNIQRVHDDDEKNKLKNCTYTKVVLVVRIKIGTLQWIDYL